MGPLSTTPRNRPAAWAIADNQEVERCILEIVYVIGRTNRIVVGSVGAWWKRQGSPPRHQLYRHKTAWRSCGR
jgi:hypothetical protein